MLFSCHDTKGFRVLSFALIASLALAACGKAGGGSTDSGSVAGSSSTSGSGGSSTATQQYSCIDNTYTSDCMGYSGAQYKTSRHCNALLGTYGVTAWLSYSDLGRRINTSSTFTSLVGACVYPD